MHGNVRLCGLSARLIEALEVTHLRGLADKLRVLELPADFSRSDPGQAGQQLLDQVRVLTAGV